MQPIRYENTTAVFTRDQVDNFGMPCHHGYDDYIVLDRREADMVIDWKMEIERFFTPIHRYNRMARFKSTLLNILGEKGNVPEQIVQIVKHYWTDTSDPWNTVRRILKSMKQQRYYVSISYILRRVGYPRPVPTLTSSEIEGILNDYKTVNDRFQRYKKHYNRSYFPNMRFIVLKILEIRGYTPIYKIPLARTQRKLHALQKLWDDLFMFYE